MDEPDPDVLEHERVGRTRQVTLPDLLTELIDTLRRAYLTPPDQHQQGAPRA
ncbi:hypothetical protein [Actinomadura harenae]|uniref:hypothetical protein n=1 Tax=Actinomadura harenae TaxID=2483351 RepID=UPI001315205F|nr:hypothetical protein [Actinomadura harenae]